MTDSQERRYTLKWVALIAAVAAVATAGVTALLVSIFEHKQEARNPFFRVVELNDTIEDPAIWGKNFPQQYDGYLRTVDQKRTKYGGSEALPRTPTQADPRSVVAQSRLEEDPRLKTMWAGYAFAKDFREERGHAYMLDDQTYTERQIVVKQPGTCMQCHASVYIPYKKLGGGDLVKGFEKMNHMSYSEARKLVQHPIACIDCHDPKNMQLRVTRPGFMAGIKAAKAAQGIKDFDVNRDATRQEMRAYVCGQCHVEYYFKGPEKLLVYPWQNGLKIENIMAYYDSVKQNDWTHAITGAGVLKAQHPEFEMWNQGIHARSGVACADCHMPYMRVGATKISDHHVQSPVLNLNRACQTCHKWSEEELKARVETIQDRVFGLRNIAMDALMDLINDIDAAKKAGANDEQLAQARDAQRHAQFYLDFVEAENSTGFHAPEEAERILAESINFTRKGQNSLRGVPMKQQPAVRQTSVEKPGKSPFVTPPDSPLLSPNVWAYYYRYQGRPMKRPFSSLNAQEALHVAIFIEERNAEMYHRFAEMFVEFRDVESLEIASVFWDMAVEERRHSTALQNLYQERFGNAACAVTEEEIQEMIEVPRLEDGHVFGPDVKSSSESLPARDRALQVALTAEQNARKFYRALGEITPETKLRRLYIELAEFEADHVEYLEKKLEESPTKGPASSQ